MKYRLGKRNVKSVRSHAEILCFHFSLRHLIADSGADAVKAGEDVSRHRGSVCTMHRYVICRFFVRHDFLPGRIVTPPLQHAFEDIV